MDVTANRRKAQFGEFSVDLQTGELHRSAHAKPIFLAEQPLQVLQMLLRLPGEMVSRDELIRTLWPEGGFGDFDHGLNKVMNKLRDLLGDSAESPKLIETVARRGYRFIAPVTTSRATPVIASNPIRRSKNLAKREGRFVDSIAVLPFENVAADPEMEYLSDGIAETVLNNLSQLKEVRVVPRTTAFRYKRSTVDVAQVGQQLGVRVVLTGRVLAQGGSLTVAAELIDAADESQLWGERYNRKIDDLFAVQEEIANEIAGKLRLHLGEKERLLLARRPTQSREAFQLFLKALYHANKWTAEGLRKGIEYFWKALDEDPAYPDPYAGLAYVYTMLGILGAMRAAEALSKARAAALKALERDDDCGGAHVALGIVRLLYEWDWSGARQELERALQLEPNNPYFRLCYGVWLNAMGRSQDAIAEMTAALDLDPLSSLISHNLASVYVGAGLEDQAIEQYLKTLELNPSFTASYGQLAGSYARKGMHEKAVELAEKFVALSGRDARSRCFLLMVYVISGKREEATACMEDLKKDASSHRGLAFICASLGDREQAFEWLEKCYQERDAFLVFLPILPEFRNLRGDPRFADLLRRIGLPIKRDVDFKPAGL